VRRHLVRVQLGGVDTIVEVARPAAEGEFPALVFAHGAGTGNHTAFREQSEQLVRAGIVCLIPDKQLDEYTAMYRDYEAMARQYLELAVWARRQEWTDANQVGYWGESEGAWIVPMSVAIEDDPTFLVLVSAPVVTPRQQGLFSACAYLANTGVPAGAFHAVPRFIGSPMPGHRLNYADFSIEPYLYQINCPVLMTYGTADNSMPTIQGALTVMETLELIGNKQVTVRYYTANHGMRHGEDQQVHPDFLTDVATWVTGLPATARPADNTQVAGSEPHQPFWVTPTPPVNWFGRLSVQGWFGAISLAGVAFGPLLQLLRRLAGRPAEKLRPELRWPFAVLTGGSAATVVGFAAYLARVVHLARNYRHERITVVWGYRGIQALAATSVAGGALLAMRLRGLAASGQPLANSRLEWLRVAAGATGAAGLLAFASYWGILPVESRPAADDGPEPPSS
jgi:dienelactone hydrolase